MTAKVYVDVLAVFSREGELIPTAFVWEDGRKYAIDKVSKPERCASRKAGGTGYRYTCQVGGKICHLTYEENYKYEYTKQSQPTPTPEPTKVPANAFDNCEDITAAELYKIEFMIEH